MSRVSLKEVLKKHQEKYIFGFIILLVLIGFYFYFNIGEESNNNVDFENKTSESEVERYNRKTTKVDMIYQREKTPETSQGLENIFVSDDPYQEDIIEDESDQSSNQSQIVNIDLDSINRVNEEKRIAQLLEESRRREELLKEQLNSRNSYSSNGGGSSSTTTSEPRVNPKPKKDYKSTFKKREISSNSKSSNHNSEVYSGAISGEQKLKTGQNITLITNEIFTTTNGVTIPKYTYIVGKVIFSEYRADIVVTSVKIGNKIHSVDLEIYGSDGTKGVPINVDRIMKKGKTDAIDDVIRSETNSSTASKIVTDVISGKAKEQEVTFVNNQTVYFKIK